MASDKLQTLLAKKHTWKNAKNTGKLKMFLYVDISALTLCGLGYLRPPFEHSKPIAHKHVFPKILQIIPNLQNVGVIAISSDKCPVTSDKIFQVKILQNKFEEE